jgi:hypothetical protein
LKFGRLSGYPKNKKNYLLLLAFIFAHLARCAALILANPAAEMLRLGAIDTTFWPRVRAHRAF